MEKEILSEEESVSDVSSESGPIREEPFPEKAEKSVGEKIEEKPTKAPKVPKEEKRIFGSV